MKMVEREKVWERIHGNESAYRVRTFLLAYLPMITVAKHYTIAL